MQMRHANTPVAVFSRRLLPRPDRAPRLEYKAPLPGKLGRLTVNCAAPELVGVKLGLGGSAGSTGMVGSTAPGLPRLPAFGMVLPPVVLGKLLPPPLLGKVLPPAVLGKLLPAFCSALPAALVSPPTVFASPLRLPSPEEPGLLVKPPREGSAEAAPPSPASPASPLPKPESALRPGIAPKPGSCFRARRGSADSPISLRHCSRQSRVTSHSLLSGKVLCYTCGCSSQACDEQKAGQVTHPGLAV